MAEIFPAFSAQAINSQVTFVFDSTYYVGTAPSGFLNWAQDPGGLNTLEARDTAVFTGDVIVVGSLATTENRDTTQLNGVISNAPSEIFPAYSALDINAQVTFNFVEPYVGSKPVSFLNWDQAPDAQVFGTLATVEAVDTAAFIGGVGTFGFLTATEIRDTALFNGGVIVGATLATIEARDTALFNAAVVSSGVLAFTETTDTAVFFGSLPDADLNSNLAFTEPGDTAVFSGQITGYVGTLIVTEAPDTAEFFGYFGDLAGDLNTIEAPDEAFFDLHVEPISEVLKFGIPVSLSRW